MSEFFVFDYVRAVAGIPPIRVAVAFCSDVAINEANLRAALKEHVRKGTPPDTLLLLAIGTNETKRTLIALVSSGEFRRSLPSTTSQLGGVNAVWMDQQGLIGGVGEGKAIFTDTSEIELVRQQGLRKIFTLRKGMLDPQGTYHYIIPRSAHSERHCDRFIRTGNVLVKSSEISFVSFWLLPYLRVDTRNIYTDTAAINSVAYAAVALRTQLDRRYKHPRIESFSSHEGLASAELELDGSLVLISASAGGKLQPRLRKEKHFRPEQIVTIYCIGPKPGTQYLCDLTKEESNPEGFDLIRGFQRSDCPHCRRGVLAIRIKGDQFFPENPEPAEHDVRGQDAPRWLRDFMEDFRGSNVIKCHAKYPTHTSRVRELYLDLLPVLDPGRLTERNSPKKFKQKLDRLLTQVIPASLGRIIYPDEPASTALAQMTLAKFRNDHPSSIVEILSTQEMDSILRDPVLKQNAVRDEGATLAVSCALVEGSRLTTMSQALRELQTNDAIQFFVAVVRTTSEEVFKDIRSSVQYSGQYGPSHFDFHHVQTIYMPDRDSPWSREGALLKRLIEELPAETDLIETLEKRLDALNQAEPEGLQNYLFWKPAFRDTELTLRRDFTFWDSSGNKEQTQAEVYFTIATVLHNLRNRWAKDSHFRHVVLKPGIFKKYNDGVLQASFLRAAEPSELNYSSYPEQSSRIRVILTDIFENVANDKGEASIEFLLALADERLQLQRTDLEPLLKDLLRHNHLPPLPRCLCEFVLNRLKPEDDKDDQSS